VTTKRTSTKLTVCILSPHPLVLSEFERILAKSQFKVIIKQLESTLAPDLRTLEPPKAQVYVIDAHAAKPATGALLANLLERFPESRLIVVGEQHNDSNSFSLLRLGVKGLLTYVEARDQLIRALPLVASGGFWVPRQLLSGFVDSILTGQGRRLKTDSVTNLSRREQEVLDSLLENLSNKEIASKLNIAERTVKFHVSNLLNKFGVRRRADLILLTFQRRLSQASSLPNSALGVPCLQPTFAVGSGNLSAPIVGSTSLGGDFTGEYSRYRRGGLHRQYLRGSLGFARHVRHCPG
jgi:two-component system nitrate/nitrite response regulator NarL